MESVHVSVCMVTYNHERYIAQAVESVLAQRTTFPFEVVVGEDCSTDATRNILQDLARRHPGKVRLQLPQRNLGMMQNFVQVLSGCRGKYVALLDGDDYWTCPRKLELQTAALESHPEWAMCFHPARCVFEDGLTEPTLYPENWQRPEASLVDLLDRNFMATGSVMFRNRLFSEVPAWFTGLQIGDWPLHILNAAHGTIGFLPDVMSVYRIHAGGIWTGQKAGSRLAAELQMLSAIDHYFVGKYTETIHQNRLKTLNWLTGQADRAHDTWQRLAASQAEVARLAEENRTLHQLQDSWHRSLTHRIAKETLRPLRQLWGQWRRLRGISDPPTKAASSPISKAA
jgi:glycosyltransferase involved in cell wall biosynthesis